MRVKYWLAGAQDPIAASAVSPDQWAAVVAVDLCVLVRGAPQGQRSRYVDCDGASVLGADLRPRQAFSRRVALRNRTELIFVTTHTEIAGRRRAYAAASSTSSGIAATRRASIAGVIRHVLAFAAWFCQSCC